MGTLNYEQTLKMVRVRRVKCSYSSYFEDPSNITRLGNVDLVEILEEKL